jgi:hypothetical protein
MKILSIFGVCLIGFVTFGNATASLNDGLVAHYQFEGNPNDTTANENHGVENGNGLSYVPGVSGQAASFTNNSRIIANGDGDLALKDWGISVWINVDSFPTSGEFRFIGKKEDANKRFNYSLLVDSGGGVRSQYETSGSDFDHTIGGISPPFGTGQMAPLTIGQWAHIVSTQDTSTGVHNLYLNGSLVFTGTWLGDIPIQNSEDLWIGGNWEAPDTSPLALDEARIYNRALSNTEIQQLYQDGKNCTSSETGTVSSNLDIHVPSLNYETSFGTLNIWVDFQFHGEGTNGELLWKLKNYGISCIESESGTVSSDLVIHIPSLNFETALGTLNIWANFEFYEKSASGELFWKLKDYGEN